MNEHTVSTLSPLDGRYAEKLAPLRHWFSEYGYMKMRVQVEITWFLALSKARQPEFPPLSRPATAHLLGLVANFSVTDCLAIKAIEQTTHHDVKAVEYWIRQQLVCDRIDASTRAELARVSEFIHFACTSEDINNTSQALQIKAARAQILLPALDALIERLRNMAHRYASAAMLGRTHGQAASPTTMGKEMAVFAVRLGQARQCVAKVTLRAKMNGAVGNYNAHLCAWPDVDWEAFSREVIEAPESTDPEAPRLGLGLSFQPYSTQIEPHDSLAELFDALARTNTILIDAARDIWAYISLGYFSLRLTDGEVGSSTMPHKVNPIDFENAEGNLGLANALLRHLSEKLPISRWQRDLSDSTVLRNTGVALGYTLLAYQSLGAGLDKLQLNPEALAADLDRAWEVLAEPIQTVLRSHGIAGAYEQLKTLTRGKAVGPTELRALIMTLDIPPAARQKLIDLSPATYTGLATRLALRA